MVCALTVNRIVFSAAIYGNIDGKFLVQRRFYRGLVLFSIVLRYLTLGCLPQKKSARVVRINYFQFFSSFPSIYG